MTFRNALHNISTRKLLFYVFIVLLGAWACYMLSTQLLPELSARFVFDPADHRVYFTRGAWMVENTIALSEYPQVSNLLFGLNRLLVLGFRPDIQLLIFISFMSLEMTLVLFFTIKILIQMLPDRDRWLSLLMFLPTTLWFVFNRFDILPAFLCLLAMHYLYKNHPTIAAVILAVATFTKWYPVLLLPAFLLFEFTRNRKFPWKSIIAFALSILVIVLPTYLRGGMDALLIPYQFHAHRGLEYFSLPALLGKAFAALIPVFNPQVLVPIFLGFQLFMPFVSPFIRFDGIENVLDYSILAIAAFVLFGRVSSPQWLIWLMPFLILAVKDKKDIWLIVFYNLVTYLAFPLAFDLFGDASIEFGVFTAFIYVALFLIIFRTIKRIHFSLDFFQMLRPQKKAELPS